MAKAPASSFNLNLLLGQRSELLLSLSLLGLLVVLLVPLPPVLSVFRASSSMKSRYLL